jgi:hypothetical protein
LGLWSDDKCNREQTSLFASTGEHRFGGVEAEKLQQVMGETVRPARA